MNYLVVGGGPAGVICAETLRKTDPAGAITMISSENEPAYSRMAIPYFLADEIAEEGTYLREPNNHFKNLAIEYLRGKTIEKIAPAKKRVTLDDGKELGYDRLLIATGARPTAPPIRGLDQPGVHPCWTLEDSRHIHKLAKPGAHVVLIGAGFIGCIILNAISARKLDITVVEADDRMVPRMMNQAGGNLIKDWCQKKGVRVLTSTRVEAIEALPSGSQPPLNLKLDNGEELRADLVITATGVTPIMDFLDGSGVKTDEGILVNDYLQTSVPEIYAAGDVAQGKDFSFGERSVHAIQPTASEHGRVAALNMAGTPTAYQGSLNMNVLDTLGLVSYSFGKWMGAKGGDHSEQLDSEKFRYIRLEFEDELLVGSISLGPFEHVGIIRGLIQSKIRLGKWKEKLLRDPKRVMEAYLACTHSGKLPLKMRAFAG